MFCPKCGTENIEGANMCRRCGWILTSAAPGAAAAEAKTSGLAIASMVLGILSIFASILTALPAIVLGIVSLVKISRSNGQLKGTGMAITGIVTPFVFMALSMAILLPALSRARFMAQRQVCASNLKQLGVATIMYTESNDDKFPTPDKWCDLLERYTRDEKLYVCPSAKQGKCNYAINGNLPKNRNQIRRPEELVLLFESKPGWNQSGGPELSTTENHRREGCNVVFCDGHAEFVRTERIDELKWETEP